MNVSRLISAYEASCNMRWGFELVPKESIFIDSRRITIQDFPILKLQRQMAVELSDDIVNITKLGDLVTLIDSIGLIKCQRKAGILRVFDYILEANNVILNNGH